MDSHGERRGDVRQGEERLEENTEEDVHRTPISLVYTFNLRVHHQCTRMVSGSVNSPD